VPFVGGGGPVAPIPCNVRNTTAEGNGTPIPYTPFSQGLDTLMKKRAYRFAAKKLCGRTVPEWWGLGTGKVSRRLVIPVLHDGDHATYQARAIYKWQRIKYVSGRRPDFRPTSECFYKVGGSNKTIVLVEGPFDCAAAYTILGVPAWGIFGTHLSKWQRNHLATRCEDVILWMDPDTPGQTAARKIAATLTTMGLPTSIAESPTDPKLATTKPSVRPAF
jgi:DNA primase